MESRYTQEVWNLTRWMMISLALATVALGLGCSQNNVGDLFPPFGSEGDPEDDGFNPPPGGNLLQKRRRSAGGPFIPGTAVAPAFR